MGSADHKQRALVLFNMAKESFKVVMASMLVVFVPQLCHDDETLKTNPHLCTTRENVMNITDWNTFVLAWNLLTVGLMVGLYVVENRREFWLIRMLDADKTKPDTAIQEVLAEHPALRRRLFVWNRAMFWTYALTAAFFAVNAVLSGVLIFNDYYLDVRSATVYITNILLLGGKMYTGVTLAHEAKKKEIAYSFYLTEPVNWNVLDASMTSPKKRSLSDGVEQPPQEVPVAPRDPQVSEAVLVPVSVALEWVQEAPTEDRLSKPYAQL